MIRKVAKYETSDKKLWDEEADAKQHENDLTAVRELSHVLRVSIRTNRPEAVVGEMLVAAEEVTKILSSYRKRRPRAKLEKAA